MCFSIKLCIGGSPCTRWSIAQTKNRETEPSGIGWELLENYLIALDKFQPDYFLYENNKSMSKSIREEITKRFGFEPICINSALVSAQNRQRLYWVGKRNQDGTYSQVDVQQPEDRGILLRDILEIGKNNYAAEPVNVTADGKAQCLRATCYKDGIRNMIANTVDRKTCVAEPVSPSWRGRGESSQFEARGDSKAASLTTGHQNRYVSEPVRIWTIESETSGTGWDSKQYRVYSPDRKSVTLFGQGGGVGAKTGLYASTVEKDNLVIQRADGKTLPVYEVRNGLITIKGKQYPIKLADGYYIIRKLTVRECMRLQTVPEWYEFPVSDTQAYKMLGNGWTVDVIAHILSCCLGITAEPLDVLSMYDGMACGHLALDKLGAHITRYRATEIDKYAIKTACHNFPDIQQLGDAFQVREPGWK